MSKRADKAAAAKFAVEQSQASYNQGQAAMVADKAAQQAAWAAHKAAAKAARKAILDAVES